MSQEAVEKNVKNLKEDCVLLVDNSVVKKVPKIKARIFRVPATEVAAKTLGEKLYANMIMLGALNKITKIVDENSMKKAIKDAVPEKATNANIQAYKKGKELIR